MHRRVLLFLVLIGCLVSRTAFSTGTVTIPKDLLFERKPLPPDVNAFTEWEKADKLFVPGNAEDLKELQEVIDGAWISNETSIVTVPPAVEAWIRSNTPALAWVEKGLVKEQAQFPRANLEKISPFLVSSRMLSRARLFQAEQATIKGDNVTATNLLLGNFKLARMIARADAPVINYLVARSIRSAGEKAIVRWARSAHATPELIENVLQALPALEDEPEIYAHVMRVEFTEFLCAELDLKKIQKQWIDVARTNAMVLAFQPEELQRALFIVHDPRLLALHPKPLDKEESISYSARRIRKLMLNARSVWRPENLDALSAETEQEREKFVKDLQPLLKATDGEAVPLSERAARKAAKHYLKVTNPVGRYWQSSDSLPRTFAAVFHMRTEREATRALLALRVHELKQGRRPESLDELVKIGLLDRLPIDYFANAPLHYSAAKGILWSVGEDGVDNGGLSGKPSWQKDDMVWEIQASAVQK